jgi:hypothetical protein
MFAASYVGGGEKGSNGVFTSFGHCSALLLAILFLLVTRKVGIPQLMGISLERAVWLHERSAELFLLLSSVHGFGKVGLHGLYTSKSVIGLIAWCIIVALVILPGFFRHKIPSGFRYAHFAFLPAVVLLVIHEHMIGIVLIPGGVFLIGDWVWMRWRANSSSARISVAQYFASIGVIALELEANLTSEPTVFQYIKLQIDELGYIGHPFTVATYEERCISLVSGTRSFGVEVDNDGEVVQHRRFALTLLIQRKEGWTADLARMIIRNESHTLQNVHVTGPLGIAQVPIERCHAVMILAQGIGVAGILSVLTYIHRHPYLIAAIRRVMVVWHSDPEMMQRFGRSVDEAVLKINPQAGQTTLAPGTAWREGQRPQISYHCFLSELQGESNLNLRPSEVTDPGSLPDPQRSIAALSPTAPNMEEIFDLFSSMLSHDDSHGMVDPFVGVFLDGTDAFCADAARQTSKHGFYVHHQTFSM